VKCYLIPSPPHSGTEHRPFQVWEESQKYHYLTDGTKSEAASKEVAPFCAGKGLLSIPGKSSGKS